MKSQHKRPIEFWRPHIEKVESCELSGAEYCRRNDLNCGQFGYWRKKLIKDGLAKTKLTQVPISVTVEHETPRDVTSGVRIVIDNLTIEVTPNFDIRTLRRTVEALRGH
jgi:hypothetical protein